MRYCARSRNRADPRQLGRQVAGYRVDEMFLVRVGPKDPDIETLIAPYLSIVFA